MTEFLASLLAALLAGVCVVVHFEALSTLARMERLPVSPRVNLLLIMFGLLFAHVVEIWIYAGGYWLATGPFELGSLAGGDGTWFGLLYYSSVVYTTVGFGDVLPTDGIRMITSSQGLTGLALITWSASFTFLEMQRVWKD